jgi:hypothetical protein
VIRHAAQDEQIGQHVDDVGRSQPPVDPDRQALPGELVDEVELAERPPLVGPAFNEAAGPDVVRTLRPQTDAGPSFSQSRPFFGCFCGTFSPSRRQIRSTRFTFTAHPASRRSAAMRRYP